MQPLDFHTEPFTDSPSPPICIFGGGQQYHLFGLPRVGDMPRGILADLIEDVDCVLRHHSGGIDVSPGERAGICAALRAPPA